MGAVKAPLKLHFSKQRPKLQLSNFVSGRQRGGRTGDKAKKRVARNRGRA
jgi:hypothetical protein